MLSILSKRPFDVVCNLELPEPGQPANAETRFYPAPPEVPEGVTVVTIRGLDYWQVVELETANSAGKDASDELAKKRAHVRAYLAHGVVAVNGNTELAAQVADSPHPRTALALYHAIDAASWGN